MSAAQPLTEHERYFFDLYGYLVRHAALGDDEVAEANQAVDRLALPSPGTDIDSQRFRGHLEREQIFRDLLDHEAVLDPILEMCGPRARLDHAYGIVMAPGTRGLGLHGGGTPHDPAQFYDVRGNRMFNGLVVTQWAIVDHPRGEGGFCCVPGSHRANFALPNPVPPSWVVTVPLDAGDVVFFTEGLTHGTTAWTAAHERRSLLYKYCPGHATWGTQYGTTLKALAESGLVTDRQRRLLQPPSVYPHEPVR
jgi:hypothetical protein